MKKFTSYFLLALFFVIIAGTTYAQDPNNPAWSLPYTSIFPSGNYPLLPQKIVPVNRSMTPRVIRTPNEVLIVNPNIQVLPSGSTTETEVPLVASRLNPSFMFGSSNAVSGSSINSGSYITTNSGNSWFGSNMINNGNTNNQRGDPGPTIDKNQRVIFTHLSSSSNFGGVTGMAGEYSTDFGQTFSASVQIHTSGTDDKNLAGTDDYSSSPYYGNSYMAFCDYASGVSYCATTTNGGVSWNSPVSWSPPSGLYAQGHDVGATPSGVVIVCYALHNNSSPYTETGVGIGRSTNGGTSFTVNAPAYNCNGTRSFAFNGWGIRTNSFPRMSIDKSGGARNGWIYVVTDEANLSPAGSDADVILHRSTDGGLTWSSGIRVNQDPLNNGKVQFFPCVNVDAGGGVNVAYFDNRNFPSSGDSCSVFISRSLDGGNTWFDVEVADHHFKPKPCTGLSGGYMGDYIGVTSGNGKVWAFWTDDKAGSPGFFNAWAGYIFAGAQPQHDIACGPFLSLPSLFLINTNYAIKTKVTNVGAANETNVPVKFFINGSLINTSFLNLNSGQSDSVSNNWMPTVAGTYTLTYASALANDTNRFNDTVRTTVTVYATLPPLCEGFNSSQFPPANWSVAGAGSSYWFRQTVSAYGNGQGSAYYDMWNAPVGTTADLISLTFPATVSAQDSIHFALAFCMFGSSNDEVAIYASTDAGTTYSLLHTMTATEMQTVSSCTHPFTPTSSQWGRRAFVLPVGTNKVKFTGISAFGDGAFLDSIGTNPCWNYTGITRNGNEIPRTYSLSQNYPNPFNPTTKIQFSLPKAGLVKLVVYDVTGAKVTTLVNGNMEPGVHDITFNGENIASGVYFYKIEAGDFTSVKKMVLVK